MEIGHGIAASGIRRLVIMSSHGGNSEVMGIAARRLRLEADMLVVPTNWARMGLPEGVIEADEARFGIHGGDIETSLMLHLRPDLVDMDRAGDFVSAARAMESEFEVLRGGGPTGFSWATGDLNSTGAIGNAGAGNGAQGRCHRGPPGAKVRRADRRHVAVRSRRVRGHLTLDLPATGRTISRP